MNTTTQFFEMNSKTRHFSDSSIVEFYNEHIKSKNQPMVVLCRDNDHAERVRHTLKSLSNANAFVIPDNETLPYDEEFPQELITSERFRSIWALKNSQNKNDVFIVTSRTIIEKIPSENFYSPFYSIKSSDKINKEGLVSALQENGYKKVATVRQYGEFSINPNTIDVFAFGNEHSVRLYIDIQKGSETNIFTFSSETQLNLLPLESFNIFSVYEYPFNDLGIRKFKARYRRLFENYKNDFFNSIKNGVAPRGIDYFKTLFTDDYYSLLQFFPKSTKVFSLIDWESEVESIQSSYESRYKEVIDSRFILMPHQILYSTTDARLMLNNLSYIEIDDDTKEERGILANKVKKQEKMHQTFKLIDAAHSETNKTLITINSETRLHQLNMMFKMKGKSFVEVNNWKEFLQKNSGYYVMKADLDYGYINARLRFTLITEFEIFDSKTMEEHYFEKSNSSTERIELREGDPIVHAKYGVGRFLGFETFADDNSEKEYAVIEYAENAKIWVALSEMSLISEYKGIDPENIPIDDASSKHWNKHLMSAIKDVKKMAYKLLEIKAKRLSIKRNPYSIPTFEYRKFSNEFPFVITQDQAKAIKSIIRDLEGDIAMDRLVVGDVGYGKTEVAMRAAMIVSWNKGQCCILAPTTLLAEQHYESFIERFAGTNTNISLLTRESKSQDKSILNGLEDGSIDIVIGTHRLIQKDVRFKNLGLMVVDEEHRFGVKQKEDINKKRGNIDILSLSATPIPRTLSLTMHGIRDISTINTAPQKRLAIRTIATELNDNDVIESLKREMGRSGQVFYVFNDTSEIENKCNAIRQLISDAKVEFAHGKMKEKDLQSIMQRFRANDFDILVATTIIETGIDIPNANTIIIESAENFGLSQLHQLRGRVGRSNRQAYAYLMTSKDAYLTEKADKRIRAMIDNNNLGGGFKICNADLEIRGAGEVLGESQSGHIQEIGYQMYFSLLEKAIQMLEQGEDLNDLSGDNRQLVFYVPSTHTISSNYIDDKGLKAAYYKSLSEADDIEKMNILKREMEARFGNLPKSITQFSDLILSKSDVIRKGVKKTRLNKSTIEVIFNQPKDANTFIKNCTNNDVAAISIETEQVNVPFSSFDRDGVIDYVRLNELLN